LGNSSTQHNDGTKKHSKIINERGSFAASVAIRGFSAGLCPSWMPWFQFGLEDEDLVEYGPVREYLHRLRNIVLWILSQSNFYRSAQQVFSELVFFGTSNLFADPDDENYIGWHALSIGEYALTVDHRNSANGCYRKFSMTADQIRAKFGQGDDRMQGLPEHVVNALKNNQGSSRFEVRHAVEENPQVKPGVWGADGMRYRSVYFDENGRDLLERGGYRGRPFIATRFEVIGSDVYGDSLGIFNLAGVKHLQKLEQDKLEALDKMVRPPLNAPLELANEGANILPGGVNYLDTGKAVSPVYQVDPRLGDVRNEILAVEDRLNDGFMVKLFLAVLGMEKREVTAYEIAKRYEEKAMILGPALQMIDNEFRGPVIDRVVEIASDPIRQWLPPPPPELEPGMRLKVEYTSALSQAQRVVQGQPIAEFLQVVIGMSQAWPQVLDKVDAEESVDQMGIFYNLPPKVVRSDNVVAEIRAKSQALQQQQMLMANADKLAGATKQMAEVKQMEAQR
jgi:hypothetical protein